MFEDFDVDIIEDAFPEKNKERAIRRKTDIKKAKRKRKIAKEVYPLLENHEYYNNLHQYSKNKIHCSCPLCRSKSKDELSISDKKKIEKLNAEERE